MNKELRPYRSHEQMTTVPRLLISTYQLLLSRERFLLLILAIGFLVVGMLDILAVAITGLFGTRLVDSAAPEVGSDTAIAIDIGLLNLELGILTLVLLLIVIVVLRSIGFMLLSYSLYRTCTQIGVRFSASISGAVMRSRWRTLQDYSSQRLAFLCGPASENLGVNVIAPTVVAASDIIILVGVIFVLTTFEPVATLCLVLFFSLVAGLLFLVARNWVHRLGRMSQFLVIANYAYMNSLVKGWAEIKSLGRADRANAAYIDLREKSARTQVGIQLSSIFPRTVVETSLIIGFGAAVLITFLTQGLEDALMTAGIFLVAAYRVLPLFLRMQGSLYSLKRSAGQLDGFFATYTRFVSSRRNIEIHQSTDTQLAVARGASGTDDPPSIVINGCKITVNEDSLPISYPNIEIESGSLVLIQGESGRGKSTLLRLIAGADEPDTGSVHLVSRGRLLERTRLDGAIALVTQSPTLLPETVKRNLEFFSESEIESHRMIQALEHLGLAERILNTERGLESLLLESATNLSGGESQRLAIARGLLQDPKIFLLDEPFSALDNDSALGVLRVLAQLRGSATVIIASHKAIDAATYDAVISL